MGDDDQECGVENVLAEIAADEEANLREEENEELHARIAALARHDRPRLEGMIEDARRRLRGELTRRELDEAERSLRLRHGLL